MDANIFTYLHFKVLFALIESLLDAIDRRLYPLGHCNTPSNSDGLDGSSSP